MESLLCLLKISLYVMRKLNSSSLSIKRHSRYFLIHRDSVLNTPPRETLPSRTNRGKIFSHFRHTRYSYTGIRNKPDVIDVGFPIHSSVDKHRPWPTLKLYLHSKCIERRVRVYTYVSHCVYKTQWTFVSDVNQVESYQWGESKPRELCSLWITLAGEKEEVNLHIWVLLAKTIGT